MESGNAALINPGQGKTSNRRKEAGLSEPVRKKRLTKFSNAGIVNIISKR